EYHGWNGGAIGRPIPRMVERVTHSTLQIPAMAARLKASTAGWGINYGQGERAKREARPTKAHKRAGDA
ncbi:MAG TPA: hypothetical protein VNZ22_02185, partial [Bacillota bacterium]|nr:hypothetical protein [Bacillota bacterium]